ncbi:MAG: hypothetical protein R3E66_06595 [bacterium]
MVDAKTGDVVGTQSLDKRLQQFADDPWTLIQRSRTTKWNSDQWAANVGRELVSDGFKVDYSQDFYLKYGVYGSTGERLWSKTSNPGKSITTMFVDIEGPWLLVSIVTGGNDSPEVLRQRADTIQVLAYELANGKLVGQWDYNLRRY